MLWEGEYVNKFVRSKYTLQSSILSLLTGKNAKLSIDDLG